MKAYLEVSKKVLDKLHEITVKHELSEIERDALIYRFKNSFDMMWKCGKAYLSVLEGIDAASPKGTIRYFREVGIFDDSQTEQALQMTDDRNLIQHTYNEAFAQELAKRIIKYEELLWDWYQKLISKLL